LEYLRANCVADMPKRETCASGGEKEGEHDVPALAGHLCLPAVHCGEGVIHLH
jgi:hypothetical protein